MPVRKKNDWNVGAIPYRLGGFSSIHLLLFCDEVPEFEVDDHPAWTSSASEVELAFDNDVSRLCAGHGRTWDAATVIIEAKKVAVKSEETTERRCAVFRRKVRRRCMGLLCISSEKHSSQPHRRLT